MTSKKNSTTVLWATRNAFWHARVQKNRHNALFTLIRKIAINLKYFLHSFFKILFVLTKLSMLNRRSKHFQLNFSYVYKKKNKKNTSWPILSQFCILWLYSCCPAVYKRLELFNAREVIRWPVVTFTVCCSWGVLVHLIVWQRKQASSFSSPLLSYKLYRMLNEHYWCTEGKWI